MAGLGRLISALGLVLLFIAGCAGEADAQQATTAPLPPTFQAIDANGVDLMSGRLAISKVQASVGPPGEGGLTQAFSTLSLWDNLSGGIYVPLGGVGPTTVTVGEASIQFLPAAGGAFTPDAGASGQTLVFSSAAATYTLTSKDGTVSVFDATPSVPADGQTPIARLSTVTRPNGEVLTYTYGTDAPSCLGPCGLLAVTSSLGYMIKYEYAYSGPLLQISRIRAVNLAFEYCDPNAATCSLTGTWSGTTFTGSQLGTWVATDSLGRSTSYTYTVGLNAGLTQIQRPGGVTTTITYAPAGGQLEPLVATVSNGVNTWTYTYTRELLTSLLASTTVTDELGHQRTLTFAPVLDVGPETTMPLTDTDALNNTTTYIKHVRTGLITRVTQPEGNYTTYQYDGRGNVTAVTQYPKPGSNLPAKVTTAVYPATCTNTKTCNKPTSVTEGGATTDFTYNTSHGGVLTVTAPAGADGIRPQARYTYAAHKAAFLDGSGALAPGGNIYRLSAVSQCATSASCANSSTELRRVYDYAATTVANNLQPISTKVLSNGGAISSTTQITYTKAGDVETTDGPLASPIIDTTVRRYDSERQLVGEVDIDPDGADTGRRAVARKFSYRPDGQLDWMELGSVASQTDVGWAGFTANERVTHGYDSAGRKVSATLSAGGIGRTLSQTSYDQVGRVECVAVRMNPAAFSSPPASACVPGVAGTEGPDRISKHLYDAAGRPTGVISGFGSDAERLETTTYTSNGAVQTVSDGNTNLTTYSYDGFDRLWKTFLPPATSGAASPYTELTYDDTTWDVIQDRRRDGTVVAYTYDARGNVLTKSAPAASYVYDNFNRVRSATENGQTITTAYDGIGRLKNTTGPLGTVAYLYNLAYQRTRITWPEGQYMQYDLDGTGAVTAIRQLGQTSGLGVLATFSYDDLGRRTGITRGNGVTTTYGYDAMSRLETLVQDLAGTDKDQTLTFGYNTASQVLSRASTNTAYAWNGLYNDSRAYEVNGLNQVTVSGAQALSYDPRGNLTSDGVTGYSYDVENRLTGVSSGASLVYDPAGRLYETTSSGGAVTRFLYDGANIIAEYSGAGAVLRRFVHGPGLDEPLVWFEGGSWTTDRRWLIADHQGSIVATTNGAGTATTVNTYDEYGIPGSSNLGRFQYTGQTWIPELGLYHYKARVYSPTLGRFLQTDPIGYDDDLNLYAYVKDDPVNASDPTGMSLWTKAFKFVLKGGDLAATFAGSVSDVKTLASPTASGIDKAVAVVNLASEAAPVSTRDLGEAASLAKKTYQTYTKRGPDDQVYCGRCSGTGTGPENVANRDRKHDKPGFGPAVLDKSSKNPDAVRGREQALIDKNGGAQSDGGTSANKIRGVSASNPKAEQYRKAMESEFK